MSKAQRKRVLLGALLVVMLATDGAVHGDAAVTLANLTPSPARRERLGVRSFP